MENTNYINDKSETEILANVRNILLPLVDSESCECFDMICCTVSNMECVECLANQIVKQYNDLKKNLNG